MEPSKQSLQASAEVDRDLMSLKERCEQWTEAAQQAIAEAREVGDMDKAKEIENAMEAQVKEIMGLLRFHGFTSSTGGSGVIGEQDSLRDHGGKFTQPGSQGHMLGYLMRKAAQVANRPGLSLVASKKRPDVKRWQKQGEEQKEPRQAAQPQQKPKLAEHGEHAAKTNMQPRLGVSTNMQPHVGASKHMQPHVDTGGGQHEEIIRHIADFVPAFRATMDKLLELAGDPGMISGRLKTADSIAEKLERKKKSVEDVMDVAGTRVQVDNLAQLRALDKRVMGAFQVKERENYIDQPHPSGSGYRSLHYTVDVDGKPVEIQLRTNRQTLWADWAHETLYKGEYKNHSELQKYAKAMSEFIHKKDSGEEEIEEPECPEEVKRLELCLEAA